MKHLAILCLLFVHSITHAQLSDFGNIDFQKADSIAELYDGESLEMLPLLAHNLTRDLDSEVEKFRAIYTWVCSNITSDHGSFVKNRKMREKYQDDEQALSQWNAEFQVEVFNKLLKSKKTVCTGYAYLMKELSYFAGIECEIVDGYGRTVVSNVSEASIPNHSWNAVRLNGKWYLCDPTWSSGHTLIPSYKFIQEYNDGYFLADPAVFVRSHYPLDPDWILMEEAPSFQEFLDAPLIYKHTYKQQLIPIEPKQMKVKLAKDELLRFVLSGPSNLDLDKIRLEIASGPNNVLSVKPEIRMMETGLLELTYPFKKRVNHDVHIKLGELYIATYVVKMGKARLH